MASPQLAADVLLNEGLTLFSYSVNSNTINENIGIIKYSQCPTTDNEDRKILKDHNPALRKGILI